MSYKPLSKNPLSYIAPCLLFTLTLTNSVFAAVPPDWGTTPDQPAILCQGLEFVFTRAVQAAVGLIGLGAFIMLLTGGFKLITSGGDAKATEQAHGTITLAIAGIALLVASIFILKFIYFFTGVDVLNFAVCK